MVLKGGNGEGCGRSSGEKMEDPCSEGRGGDDGDVYQVFEEFDFSQLTDTSSIASCESFYPLGGSLLHQRHMTPESPETLTFFKACCNNNAVIVKIMIRQRVTEEEVQEVDKNNRTWLIVACYRGYVDVVIALARCPYVDGQHSSDGSCPSRSDKKDSCSKPSEIY
uniref:Ankyrin repeat domain 33Bb n=1 Tax=Electrophorus electricus TaxID=8005 RepID=A0A4W4F9V1_ELEEL